MRERNRSDICGNFLECGIGRIELRGRSRGRLPGRRPAATTLRMAAGCARWKPWATVWMTRHFGLQAQGKVGEVARTQCVRGAGMFRDLHLTRENLHEFVPGEFPSGIGREYTPRAPTKAVCRPGAPGRRGRSPGARLPESTRTGWACRGAARNGRRTTAVRVYPSSRPRTGIGPGDARPTGPMILPPRAPSQAHGRQPHLRPACYRPAHAAHSVTRRPVDRFRKFVVPAIWNLRRGRFSAGPGTFNPRRIVRTQAQSPKAQSRRIPVCVVEPLRDLSRFGFPPACGRVCGGGIQDPQQCRTVACSTPSGRPSPAESAPSGPGSSTCPPRNSRTSHWSSHRRSSVPQTSAFSPARPPVPGRPPRRSPFPGPDCLSGARPDWGGIRWK